MDLSIIIVSYNSLKFIKNCIESLFFSIGSLEGKENKNKITWELIIVDNGSSDGSIEYLKKLELESDWISVIEMGENRGFCSASNIGTERARGEFLLFLNPDTKFIQKGLDNLIKFYDEESKGIKVGIIGAKLLNFDNSLQYSCRSFPTLARQFYESYFLHRLFKKSRVFGSYFLSNWDHKSVRKVDWLSGAFMFSKREFFIQAGSFDEDYFMYSEDADLCLRMHMSGYKHYYYPYFAVQHSDSGIASRDKATREVGIWKSRRLYFKKNYSLFHALVLSCLYFFGVINRILLFMILSVFGQKKKGRKKLSKEKLGLYFKTLKLYFCKSSSRQY